MTGISSHVSSIPFLQKRDGQTPACSLKPNRYTHVDEDVIGVFEGRLLALEESCEVGIPEAYQEQDASRADPQQVVKQEAYPTELEPTNVLEVLKLS